MFLILHSQAQQNADIVADKRVIWYANLATHQVIHHSLETHVTQFRALAVLGNFRPFDRSTYQRHIGLPCPLRSVLIQLVLLGHLVRGLSCHAASTQLHGRFSHPFLCQGISLLDSLTCFQTPRNAHPPWQQVQRYLW